MRTTRSLLLSYLLVFFFIAVAIGAQAQAALQFVSVTPCRVVDTRNPAGPFGGPSITGGTFRSFPIPQGACNIPATAVAYSLNVTIIPSGPVYVLTVWPAGQPQPGTSTLNSYDGRVKANAAIVPAGSPDEAVSVYASATTDVALDINGYFIPATQAALQFYPLAPCRVADTRNPDGPLGGPFISGGATPRDIPVLQAAACNIPSSAAAYSLNFTVVPRVKPMWVFNAWPDGQPQPNTSVLNDPTGTVVANASLMPAGTNGDIDVYSSGDTDMVIDIDGYFAPPAQSGLALYTLAPCRVLDTRLTTGLFSGQLAVDVLGSPCGVPASSQAYTFNATVVPSGPMYALTLWPDGQIPTASTLNAWDGQVTSNLAIVTSDPSNGMIQAYAAGHTQLILDIASYFAPLPPLSITTTTLPDGTTNLAYTPTQLLASGGEPPYSWTITSGDLPPGMNLSTAGVISGTPTQAGIFPFTVKVTDVLSNTASADLSITVSAGTLVVTTTSLPDGTVTVPYDATLGAAGGVPPYTWSLVSGSLPDGLHLTASSGLISGTPTTPGASNFRVQVQDADQTVAQASLRIVIDAATNNGSLSGPYAFSFNGFNHGKALFMAGSFIADGNGHITSGVLDYNNGIGSQLTGFPFSGSYTITADGLGTMTFNTLSLGTFNFHVAVSKLGNGTFIQDNEDPDTRGSGAFYVQIQTDFSIPPSGGYAFGTIGADQNFNPYYKAGAFQVSGGGTVTDGVEDVNDNGVLLMRNYTGTFKPPSPQSGRGQLTLNFQSVTNNYYYYVVSKGQFIVIGTDPVSSLDPLTLTTTVPQGAGLSNASLQGNSIIEVSGVVPNNGQPEADVVLGLFSADGAGNATATIDENKGGTLTQKQVSQGTYSVAANGRVTLSGFGGTTPILYVSTTNQAFVVGQDTSVIAGGILEWQTSPPPYNNLSIFGTYLGGSTTPVLSALVDNVTWLSSDGNGNLNGIQDTSAPDGSGTDNVSATYQVDSTGRAVLTGTPAGIMYVISAKKIVLLPSGDNPVLSSFSAAATNNLVTRPPAANQGESRR